MSANRRDFLRSSLAASTLVSMGAATVPTTLGRVADEGSRAAGLRAEQEAFGGLIANGEGSCRRFTAGHAFRLERHGDADGAYLLTSVHHEVRLADHYQPGQGGSYLYTNTFECTPPGLPVRPARRTPRPCVPGPQTGLVVGPPGEEVFTDRYGRVKVRFHWDREGGRDADGTCWVRVATPWAGNGWGMVHLPRIGQEVIVAFQDGDPDRPVVLGTVTSAAAAPPSSSLTRRRAAECNRAVPRVAHPARATRFGSTTPGAARTWSSTRSATRTGPSATTMPWRSAATARPPSAVRSTASPCRPGRWRSRRAGRSCCGSGRPR